MIESYTCLLGHCQFTHVEEQRSTKKKEKKEDRRKAERESEKREREKRESEGALPRELETLGPISLTYESFSHVNINMRVCS